MKVPHITIKKIHIQLIPRTESTQQTMKNEWHGMKDEKCARQKERKKENRKKKK